MKLRTISPSDKKVFDEYLNLRKHYLSCYSFENIYIWKGLFDIYWQIFDRSLCVFFRDKFSCFLYLEPLGELPVVGAIDKSFLIMDRINKNREISRIENIEEINLPFYRSIGLKISFKSHDYICLRDDLIGLKGDGFKAKRALCNYFVKNYKFDYLPFSISYCSQCLKLYEQWMRNRRSLKSDKIYSSMLEDNFNALKFFLKEYPRFNCTGRIIKINNVLKGFTFGFPLSKDTFCILYEITDLSIKGLAQFIFRSFCRDLTGYRYINIMDDSGLENLKKTKLSYRPFKLIPAYILSR